MKRLNRSNTLQSDHGMFGTNNISCFHFVVVLPTLLPYVMMHVSTIVSVIRTSYCSRPELGVNHLSWAHQSTMCYMQESLACTSYRRQDIQVDSRGRRIEKY